jgi:uncharacterized membrane protein
MILPLLVLMRTTKRRLPSNELNMIRAFAIAGVLLIGSSAALAQSRNNLTLPKVNPFDEMLPMNFCEVIQNAQRYDGKIIRVRAIFLQHFEG